MQLTLVAYLLPYLFTRWSDLCSQVLLLHILLSLARQQVAPEILAAYAAWIKGSKEIDGLLLMTIEPEIQRNRENLHAHEMLKELKTLFAQQVEQELLQTVREFHHSCEGERQFIQNQWKRKNKLAYALKPKIPPPPKREDPAKDSIYHECGETGHWKRKCPLYLAELLKKKKLSLGASNLASDKELEEVIKDQLLPVDASPIALPSDYISDSDPEEDDEEDPERSSLTISAERRDNDDNESSNDDDDDDDVKDEEDEEEEEHLAPTDPSAIPTDGLFQGLNEFESIAYKLKLPQELSRVHNTFHVSNLKKCCSDDPLAIPLEGLHIDDKFHLVEEPVVIMDRDIKRLKSKPYPNC
ncbi:zinc finger, CCHC-type containing protein [Tanacetum coccineum]